MQIKEHSKKRKCVGGRDTISVKIVYTPSDIKKALQRHLKELRQFGIANKFREEDLKEFFMQRVFNLLPEKHLSMFADWAYDISLKKNYVTSNRWDREKPTIYFINEKILSLRPGPTGPRTAKGFEALERKKQREKEKEKET